jgi:hypothetical protein
VTPAPAPAPQRQQTVALTPGQVEGPIPHLDLPSTIHSHSRQLVEALDTVDYFALGGVGFSGSPNPGETITLDIARRPDAVEAFTWLAHHGHPIARLYAYWALRTLAPERALAIAPALEADTTEIHLMSGCMGYREPVGQIAANLKRRDRSRAMPVPGP